MTKTNQERLFAEFPEVSTSTWEEVINKDLKGADYARKLVWRTAEGFNVRPYYRAEDLAGIDFLGSKAGEYPFVRGIGKKNNWRVHQTVRVECVAAAAAEAQDILKKGVDSVGFCLSGLKEPMTAEQLDTLLEGIDLSKVEVVFNGKNLVKTANLLLDKLDAIEGLDKKHIRASFGIDPIVKDLSVAGAFCCGGDGQGCYDSIAALIARAAEYKHMKLVTVNAHHFGNSGATIVEELSFALAAGHDYLVKFTEMGLPIEAVARTIRFSLSVSANYFMEIAKIRAARLLWSNIVMAYSLKGTCPAKMYIHAVTSKWNQTAYDPYVNMLRGTTEAMSAAIAGVQSLEVLPFNASFETPDEFSKRIARNAELLLKHESHFDQVVDPAGGSYYIENLTQSIATEAWAKFNAVEQKGGYVAAFNEGYVVQTVKASAAAKDKNIATRREILLGANQYPNFTEVAAADMCSCAVTRECSEENRLTPYRGAMAFEAMRLGVDRSEREPQAFMLTCGNLSMARARSQFACNFFACAGIRVVDNTYFASVEEGAKAALAVGAEIVVICAADDDYATLAPEAKALLGDKAILVVAGAPACAPELEAQGITNFISVKSNVLETLKSYLKAMNI
ncbi:MAG: methylmalonyl-CoA mutase family protein [Rikenellaceae bacterium]